MRIKLLIAAADGDYAEHLSNTLSEKYSDAFVVSVCSTAELLADMLAYQKFDAALLEASLIEGVDLRLIQLPLLLWTESAHVSGAADECTKVRKYQRISSIACDILESCAKTSFSGRDPISQRARITAVWSPAGGVGKTSVALAFAAQKKTDGKQVLYLNLESFSSTPVYFDKSGKSISAVFDMLDNDEGNLKMLIRAIRRQDSVSGIEYFCHAENFDDMNILSVDDAESLIRACCTITDELVVDLSCVCNKRTWQVLELADRILIVADQTRTSQIKLSQFTAQHSVFQRVRAKAALIANKGAAISEPLVDAVISLPLVQSADESLVYKTLANSLIEVD